MTRWIDEIVDDIKTCPEAWSPTDNSGGTLGRDNIELCGYGNGWLLSCVAVRINREWNTRVSMSDTRKLELAIHRWYANAPLSKLTGVNKL